jgi:hypothetical protein
MFSMPPATATLMLPRAISCAAETMACAPEPQTRLSERRNCHRQPGMYGCLPGRIHLGARLHDIAHDNRFHLIGAEFRASNRGADRDSPEIGRRHVLQAAAKGADRGANRFGKNDCTRCHDKAS